jgi:autotransporter-associated beta strand protein
VVNSLTLLSAGLSGTGTLSLVSGVVLKKTEGLSTISANLDFGQAEGQVFVSGTIGSLILSGTLSGSAGLTKSGENELVLSGTNQISGPLTINSGQVSFTTPTQLGIGPAPVRLGSTAAGTGLFYNGTGTVVLPRNIELLGGYGYLRTGLSTTAILDITGTISGEGGLRITGGSGSIRLGNANSYTGPTVISGGVRFASDSAFGNGGWIELLSASTPVQLEGGWISDRRILISGSPRIALDGHDALWTGPVEGGGSFLTVDGPGAFTWTAPSSYSGTVIANQSADWRLSGTGTVRAVALNAVNGARIVVDNVSIANSNRLADNAALQISGGFSLSGNAAQPIEERVGTLTFDTGKLAPAVTLQSPGNFPTILNAASLTTNPLLPVVIGGDKLGGDSGGFTRLVFRTAPALSGRLIPLLLVADAATGAPDSFALYDTATDAAGIRGVRGLLPADFAAGSTIRNPANGGATATDANVLIDGNTTASGAANSINSLTLAGGGVLSLDASQTLAVSVPALLARSGANARIEGGELLLGTTAIAITNGDLALQSRLTGATTLEKYGSGTLTLSPSAFSNALVVREGVARFSAPSPFSLTNATVVAGATLDLGGTDANLAAATIDGTLALGTAAWHQRGSGNVTGAITGIGDVWLHKGQLNVTSPAAYTGGTFLEREPSLTTPVTLALSGNGSLLASSRISLVGATRLSLMNQSSPAGLSRIGGVPVGLDGSILDLTGNPATPTLESAGSLTGQGFSVINLTSAGSPATELRFAELIRQERATFGFTGIQGLAAGNGATNLIFHPGLTSALVGAGTTGTNVPILPFALHDFDGTLTPRPTLVTYSPITGIRPLNLATEYSPSFVTGANVRLTTTAVQDAPVTVNALVADNFGITGAGTISVTSGTVVTGRTMTIANPLAFGSAEANLFVANNALQLNGPVSGSGGLTITGTRIATASTLNSLSLFGENTFTGPITVNGGGLTFQRMANLGPDTGEIVLNDGYLTFSRTGFPTPFTFTRPIRLAGSFGELSGDAQFFVSGPISGPGALSVRNIVTLTGVNTYAGPTILSGQLRFTSDAALGSNAAILLKSGGHIKLLQPWNTARRLEFAVNGSLTFDSAGFDAAISGGIGIEEPGVGAIGKWGAGTLRISGDMEFLNDINVFEGALAIDGTLVTPATSVLTVRAGATFTGEAQIPRVIDIFGTLAPGNGPGVMTTGNIKFEGGSMLALEIASVAAFDRIKLTGTISLLGNTALQISLQFDPSDGLDRFTIIDNDGTDPVSFTGNSRFTFGGTPLNEGQRFTAGGQEFQISYAGGDGNDVVLTATPEPSALALFASGGLLCLRRRR